MCELYSSWYWIWGFSSWNHVGCLIYSGEVQECINPTCIYKAFFQAHSLPTWACIIWLLWSTTVATHNMPWYPTGHGYSNMTKKEICTKEKLITFQSESQVGLKSWGFSGHHHTNLSEISETTLYPQSISSPVDLTSLEKQFLRLKWFCHKNPITNIITAGEHPPTSHVEIFLLLDAA